jgi:hypothetical protein
MPNFVSSNTIKFLVGLLVGAALMMLKDMNDIFVELEQQSPSSSTGITFDPTPLSLKDLNSRLRAMERSSEQIALSKNPYVKQMQKDPRLHQSALQCSSVWRKMDALPSFFNREHRFDTSVDDYGAIVLSDEMAYLHIWANGNRTVIKVAEDQSQETQRRKDFSEIKNRKWMALVRDPIQHFMEGWALAELKLVQEAREKDHDDLASLIMASWETSDKSYDDRVSEFLDRVKEYSVQTITANISPLMHALPQTNFLMDDVGSLHPNIAMIGEVNEWKPMMELAGFRGDAYETVLDPLPTIRAKYFPSEVNRLSKNTLVKLCDFLALDYYLLSYDAPMACLKKDGPLDFPKRRRQQQRKLQIEGEY